MFFLILTSFTYFIKFNLDTRRSFYIKKNIKTIFGTLFLQADYVWTPHVVK